MHKPTRRLSVLVVDDDRDGAETLADILRLAGHEVRVALTPTTAAIEATSFAPDALLLDIGIPGMDGYRLARRLCDLLGRKPLMVAVTGYDGLEDRSRREGFDHHFLKPADPAAIEGVLSGHAHRLGLCRRPDAQLGPQTGSPNVARHET
jgi:CheY-like chemotaxis protein